MRFSNVVSMGDMMKKFGEPRHRLGYVIEKFGIEPIGRVGTARIWSVDDLPRIKEALAQTAATPRSMARLLSRGPMA